MVQRLFKLCKIPRTMYILYSIKWFEKVFFIIYVLTTSIEGFVIQTLWQIKKKNKFKKKWFKSFDALAFQKVTKFLSYS